MYGPMQWQVGSTTMGGGLGDDCTGGRSIAEKDHNDVHEIQGESLVRDIQRRTPIRVTLPGVVVQRMSERIIAWCVIGCLMAGSVMLVPVASAQQDDGQPGEQPVLEDVEDTVEFSATSEPIELIDLVNFVAEELEINVSVKGTLTGTVMFNAQQVVPRSQLLELLEALLAQYNYSIIRDPVGIYLIQPASEITQSFGGEFATTKIISTPNVKPSSLKAVLDPSAGGGVGSKQISYVDDLGVLVVTDTPRNVRAIEELVKRVLEQYAKTRYTRIELHYVAAAAARERAISLVGQGAALRTGQQGNGPVAPQPGQASSLDNLADRLTLDPSGNSLIFRGNEEEIDQVRNVIQIIDVPTTLKPKEYFAGASASMIANIASQRGLGEVIKLDENQDNNQNFFPNFGRGNQNNGQNQNTTQMSGGSVMMVDEVRGKILYYGTAEQQAQLATLIDALETNLEQMEIRRYPVKNVDAKDLADLLQAVIERDNGNNAPLLPGSQNNRNNTRQNFRQLLQSQADAAGSETGFTATAQDAFVTAHEETNAVIVAAPVKVQEQFAKLIAELDVRRPQVYVEAKILAVSNTRDFRLAVEGQLQAGQFQTQTAFGLGTTGVTGGGGTTGSFTDPKLPLAGLGGYTASLIKSSYVPFILNAIQTDTDGRILSSPQLLVNDNEEAEIVSVEEQPTSTTTIGQTSDQTSFGGFQSAGTTLRVTPSISEAGYIRLAYEIELSNFTGSGSNGLPPPKNTRNVRSDSVTIPTDTTIVVGGITVSDTRNTIVKVPLLGDIPIVGHLFRDTNKIKNDQVLYVFITPRILNDRNFADLRLLTEGPQNDADIPPDIPELTPSTIDLIVPDQPQTQVPAPQETPDNTPTVLPVEPAVDPTGTLIPLEDDEGVVRRSPGGDG